MCGELRAFAEQEFRQEGSPPDRLREVVFDARNSGANPSSRWRVTSVKRTMKTVACTFATSNLSSFSPPPRPLRNDRTGFFFMAVELVAVAAAAATFGANHAKASKLRSRL
jgi:hypothetical protein